MTIFEWLHKSIPLTWSEYLTRQVLHWHHAPPYIPGEWRGRQKLKMRAKILFKTTSISSNEWTIKNATKNKASVRPRYACEIYAHILLHNCFCCWILAWKCSLIESTYPLSPAVMYVIHPSPPPFHSNWQIYSRWPSPLDNFYANWSSLFCIVQLITMGID